MNESSHKGNIKGNLPIESRQIADRVIHGNMPERRDARLDMNWVDDESVWKLDFERVLGWEGV